MGGYSLACPFETNIHVMLNGPCNYSNDRVKASRWFIYKCKRLDNKFNAAVLKLRNVSICRFRNFISITYHRDNRRYTIAITRSN